MVAAAAAESAYPGINERFREFAKASELIFKQTTLIQIRIFIFYPNEVHMSKTIFTIVLLLGLSPMILGNSYLMRFADVSDKHIVFTYENDLWLTSVDGGEAYRLTNGDGVEHFAKFSPDGAMVAFSANYDGGSDVYVMSVSGGEPQRLTYHPAGDLVLGWMPDGQSILFRSRRNYPNRADQLYTVPVKGGFPTMLPVDRAGLASVSADGKRLAYNRNSREFRTWKRHQGGTAQDIWLGSFARKDYKRITTFAGTDNFPMWHGEFIYFTSDRNDGTMNLFRIHSQTNKIEALTNYDDYDVKYPSMGPGHIVYQYGEELYLYDLAKAQSKKVSVNIVSDLTGARDRLVSAARNVRSFALSPDGEYAAIESRGEIIVFPVDKKDAVKNMSQMPGSREKDVAWSPDGKMLTFFSDKSGEDQLYLKQVNSLQPAKALTSTHKGYAMKPVWSPDSKWIIFHDKTMRLNLVNAATGKIKVIAQGDYDDAWENWGIQDYAWSPDSRYVAYAMLERSLNQSIFIYDLNEDKTHRVTGAITQDWSPSFSPDGKYLLFLSNRTYNPVMGFADQNHVFLDMTKPYAVVLGANDYSPFDEVNSKESKKSKNVSVKIDFAGLANRVVAAPVKPGNYFRLEAIKGGFLYMAKKENEFLKYQTVTNAYSQKNLHLMHFKYDGNDNKEMMSGLSQYHLSADVKQMIYKSGSMFGVVAAGKKAKAGDGELDLGQYKFATDRSAEFLQIYNEAWRVQRDWFYDANMHGVNWAKVGDKYRKFLPYCGNREDVNYLIGEMIAELNAGHTYIYGGERESYTRIRTGLLGAKISYANNANLPRIEHIHQAAPWEAKTPFNTPGNPLRKGDYILAVDGEKIAAGQNIYALFQNKAGKVVELTYSKNGSWQNAKTHKVVLMGSEGPLQYREWVNNNAKYVAAQTNEKVGYIHLPNMMQPGLIEFARAFYGNYYKDGLIIDARYNGGGFVSSQIIDRLERTLQTYTQPREGKPITDPERTFNGKLVLLINRDTGSDGELFSDSWKRLNLGPVIGQRTWGGSVGIEPHQDFIDGGATSPPQFARYDAKKVWIIEGQGVEPDIVVVNDPQKVLQGEDQQLNKGIDVILSEIKTKANPVPVQPPYPDKSKPTLK
jgi:tricorn protease